MTRHLYGMHDAGGEHLFADKPGWIVHTVALTETQAGDYRHLAQFGNIVRLNWAHNGVDGTIPRPSHYAEMAQRAAAYVGASAGCDMVIIGNEPNHIQERPGGDAITPAMYADCFNLCYAAIKDVKPDCQVGPAAIAPWDASTKYPGNDNGDWVIYARDVWERIPRCDFITLHTYTHGAGIHLITSSARMQAPFQHRRFEFRAYLDFLDAVPQDKRHLPVHITETNQGDAWVNSNIGWVQAAYAEINSHNQADGTQKIHGLALYRWPNHDRWGIVDKPGVHDDLRAAVAKGYQSPQEGKQPMPHAPDTDAPPAKPSTQPAQISNDFERRVPDFWPAKPQPGQRYYQLVKAEYVPDGARRFGPDHHILVDVLGADGKRAMGVPVNVFWGDNEKLIPINKTSEPYGADYAMHAHGNSYGVWVGDSYERSDRVFGMGLGTIEQPDWNHHVTYYLVFQEAIAQPATTPATTHLPSVPKEDPPTMPTGIIEPRVAQAILKIESGGRTHGTDGRVIIRFEPHIFAQYVTPEAFARRFQVGTPKWNGDQHRYRDESGNFVPFHGNQAKEYHALNLALELNSEGALRSISMGAGQIMGFNHARVGFPTAAAMFQAFQDSTMQAIGFMNYFLSDPALMAAMHRKDWREIARRYNGSGAVDTYAPLLERAYRELG